MRTWSHHLDMVTRLMPPYSASRPGILHTSFFVLKLTTVILRVDDVYVLTGYCLIGVVNVHACVGSHSGWLKIYHFGVAKALQEGQLVDRAKFVGSSAGSLICLALALGLDFDRIRE